MKKNIQINLFGTLYNIDEDAYQLLDNYLQSMKRYFSTQEVGEEVADDIEHRVAELLWEKKDQGMEAVNVDVIKEIIGKIGNPQEICEGEGQASADSQEGQHAESQGQQEANGQSERTSGRGWQERLDDAADAATESAEKAYNKVKNNIAGKKLYRDPMDKVLGGVCSGLAKYFGGDPVLWRLILVLVFLLEGFGLIVYIVLWIVIPEARTPEDRLRMEGQSVNPNTLNQQIIKEQDYVPVQHKSNGCLIGCLVVLAIPIGIAAIGCIIGLIGGAIGLVGGATGGLVGALFEMVEAISSVPFEILFGTSHIEGAASIIVGIILVVAALVTGLIFLIKTRGNSTMKKSTKWILAIAIIACLLLGVHNIVEGKNRVYYYQYDDDWSEVDRVEEEMENVGDRLDEIGDRLDEMDDDVSASDSVVTIVSDTIVKGDTTIIKTKRKSRVRNH